MYLQNEWGEKRPNTAFYHCQTTETKSLKVSVVHCQAIIMTLFSQTKKKPFVEICIYDFTDESSNKYAVYK